MILPKDLVLCGGQPNFATELHVGLPHLGPRNLFDHYVDRIYKSQRLSNHGPIVQELEATVSQQTQTECIAVCNATVGLQLVAKALDLTGEVIVPTFTFIATVNALRWVGLTPIFCDVDAEYLLNPEAIERAITARTSAILGVHLWGQPCHVDRLREIANKHSLKLIFDAAHALGCSYHGQSIGSFGDAEIFSLHATKFINCGEGGIIATTDSKLAINLRLMIKHGFDTYESIAMDGTNAKMPEVVAAMGLTCFADRKMILDANRSRHMDYSQRLSILQYDSATSPNYQYIITQIPYRDLVVRVLWAEEVFVRKYFFPLCHQLGPNKIRQHLPQAKQLAQTVLALPTGPAITMANVAMICDIIVCVAEHHDEIGKCVTKL